MNKFTKMSSLARQKSLPTFMVTVLVLLVIIIVSLVYGIPSMLPILLIYVMVVVTLLEPDYRRRILNSIGIVMKSILEVAGYASLFFLPVAIFLAYVLLEDICRLTTGDIEGCEILENNNVRLIVAIIFFIAFGISILFVYSYSKQFKRLMKVLSLGGKILFLILLFLSALLILLSTVFINDMIRGDRDLLKSISPLGYAVLTTFLYFTLFVVTPSKIAVESRHCKRCTSWKEKRKIKDLGY